MLVLLLPVIVFIFVMGWAIYWIGDQQKPNSKKQSSTFKKDNVSIGAINLEEPEEIKFFKKIT